MADPGVSFKCATLVSAWQLLEHGKTGDRYGTGTWDSTHPTTVPGTCPVPVPGLPEDSADAVEELALASGMRSRRVLLDAGWWKQAATPMLARVQDRRSIAREGESAPNPSSSSGTGWVALVP